MSLSCEKILAHAGTSRHFQCGGSVRITSPQPHHLAGSTGSARSASLKGAPVLLDGNERCLDRRPQPWWQRSEQPLERRLRVAVTQFCSQKRSKSHARFVLCRSRLPVPARLLGVHQGLRQILRRSPMDYLIAGIASVGLFLYLIVALLRPEKF